MLIYYESSYLFLFFYLKYILTLIYIVKADKNKFGQFRLFTDLYDVEKTDTISSRIPVSPRLSVDATINACKPLKLIYKRILRVWPYIVKLKFPHIHTHTCTPIQVKFINYTGILTQNVNRNCLFGGLPDVVISRANVHASVVTSGRLYYVRIAGHIPFAVR